MGLADPQTNGSDHGDKFSKYSRYQKMDAEIREEEEIQDHQSSSINSNKYVLACAIFASLNSVLLGYDVGVMSGAILFIEEDLDLNQVQVEILVGCLSIVSLLGSLGGGRTSDAIGRKWTMGLAAIIFQTGAAIMAAAPSFLVLMIGRLLAGIGIGFGVMIAPIYIAEMSPAVARGALTSFPEIFINLGILLGYVSNYAFSGLSVHTSWRVMLAVGILPSVLIAGALFVIPESPRWLVMKNRVEEARYILLKIDGNASHVEERLAEIEEAAGIRNAGKKYEETHVWSELLRPSPVICRMLITGLGIQFFQQITGIDALVYYSPTVFKDAGVEGNQAVLAATVAVGFTKTIFILVAIFLIDRAGRKPLLYVSTVGMTCCLLGLSVTLSLLGHGSTSKEVGIGLAILMVCGNVAFFSVGIGPICWVLTSEIFPLRLRAQAAALGAVANRVSSGLVAMSFLSLAGAISVAGTFCIFGIVSALSVAFVYYLVPETKGKTLEQIELLFQDAGALLGGGGELELADVERLVQKG